MVTRRQFLRADVSGNRAALRPPWAIQEWRFREKCTGCKDCIRACPEKILVEAGDNYPMVNFVLGECTFCGACVQSCETGALSDRGNIQEPWQAIAYVESHCLVKAGSWCSVCVEECEHEAISISSDIGRAPILQVNADKCTGCGACVGPCPVAALVVKPKVV